MDLPETQRAYILPQAGSPPTLAASHPVPAESALLPGQCLVRLSHSGVCRSDLGILRGGFSHLRPKPNLIGGHEGVGVVVAMHEADNEAAAKRDGDLGDTPVRMGSRVGVKYIASTCMKCEMCLGNSDQYCSSRKSHGMDTDGTFAEYTIAYKDHLIPIPEALDSAAAATTLCAGVVAYNAVSQSNAKPGDWVAIFGAGGGVGHFVIQYATALGMRVIAIDTGSHKHALCTDLGASAFIDFATCPNIAQEVLSTVHEARKQNVASQAVVVEPVPGVHAIIVAAGSSAAYDTATAAAMTCLRPCGTFVAVGLPVKAQILVPVNPLAMRGLSVRGVFVGTRKQTREALKIAAEGKVKPRYVLRGLSEIDSILDELEKGETIGKTVLDISK